MTFRTPGLRTAQWLAVWAVVLLPACVLACPACAGRDGEGMGPIIIMGVMILLPFLVAFVVFLAVRRLIKRSPVDVDGGVQSSLPQSVSFSVPIEGGHE